MINLSSWIPEEYYTLPPFDRVLSTSVKILILFLISLFWISIISVVLWYFGNFNFIAKFLLGSLAFILVESIILGEIISIGRENMRGEYNKKFVQGLLFIEFIGFRLLIYHIAFMFFLFLLPGKILPTFSLILYLLLLPAFMLNYVKTGRKLLSIYASIKKIISIKYWLYMLPVMLLSYFVLFTATSILAYTILYSPFISPLFITLHGLTQVVLLLWMINISREIL